MVQFVNNFNARLILSNISKLFKLILTNRMHTRYIFVTLLRSIIVLRITVIFSPPNVTWKKKILDRSEKRVKDGSQNRGIRGETNGIQEQQEVVSARRTVSFLLWRAFSFLPFLLFCRLSSFVFYEHFLIFCKNRVDRITNPLFFFERALRLTLISKVGTTCLGLKNIMYSLCKYCYDQLCSFQFRLFPSRSLAFSAPIVFPFLS